MKTIQCAIKNRNSRPQITVRVEKGRCAIGTKISRYAISRVLCVIDVGFDNIFAANDALALCRENDIRGKDCPCILFAVRTVAASYGNRLGIYFKGYLAAQTTTFKLWGSKILSHLESVVLGRVGEIQLELLSIMGQTLLSCPVYLNLQECQFLTNCLTKCGAS